jgi:hypothetical protein
MDSSTVMLQHLEKHIEVLYNYLLSCGITPKDKQLSTLTEALKEVKSLKPSVKYMAYEVNAYGYIINAVEMATFTGVKDVPADITKGYYKVDKKGNIVLDTARKAIIWGD